MAGQQPQKQTDLTSTGYAWDEEGRLVSNTYGDIYFSRQDGLLESRHVFLHGNNLPERFFQSGSTVNNTDGKLAGSFSERPFAICEIGFGTGLNFLVTLLAWSGAARKQIEKLQANQHAGQLPQIRPLTYIACDQLFLPVKEMKTVHANWPELAAVSSILLAAMDQAEWTDNACTLKLDLFPADNYARLPLAPVTLHLIGGEITETIRRLENGYLKINAWFLDGFAPDRNPAMWSEAVFDGLKNDSAPDATAATYSCAAHVREQFTRAGFAWEKTPGFGKKRFMLQASLLMQKNYNT